MTANGGPVGRTRLYGQPDSPELVLPLPPSMLRPVDFDCDPYPPESLTVCEFVPVPECCPCDWS